MSVGEIESRIDVVFGGLIIGCQGLVFQVPFLKNVICVTCYRKEVRKEKQGYYSDPHAGNRRFIVCHHFEPVPEFHRVQSFHPAF